VRLSVQKNRELMTLWVDNGGSIFRARRFFDDDLEFMTKAVTRSIDNLSSASWRLREDRDFVLMASSIRTPTLEEFKSPLTFVDRKFSDDREIVLGFCQTFVTTLRHAPLFQDDFDVVNSAVSVLCGEALEYASARLQDNEDIVATAVASHAEALKFASERVKALYCC